MTVVVTTERRRAQGACSNARVFHILSEPAGCATAPELAEALRGLRSIRPDLDAAVVKHDDAFAGAGNRIIRLRDLPPPGHSGGGDGDRCSRPRLGRPLLDTL